MVRHFRRRVILALLALFLCACAQQQATTTPHPSPRPTSTQPVRPLQADAEGPSPCTQIGQEWRSAVDGATLVCVPAGEFVMGAADNDLRARDDEKPQHVVYLDAFWIDRTKVSNAQFTQCVAERGCHPREYAPYLGGVSSKTRLDYYENPAYGRYPVLLFNADEAAAYCRWAGRRLPSEAEWEKAARGPVLSGVEGTGGRTYPWGEGIDCGRASYYECTNDTTPVTEPLAGASPYGALNMAGTPAPCCAVLARCGAGDVWEWVADWYDPDYYARSPVQNPSGPERGAGHVRRGGGCTSLARDLRVTARASGQARHYFDGQMGFRCALDDTAP